MSTSKIYIDVQSLFDLRHSALFHMYGEEKAHDIVMREPYNLREIDQDEGDNETFQAFLASDDIRVFHSAPLTYIQVLLASKVDNMEKRNAFMAETATPEVVLNTYPYQLTKEQCDILQNAVFLKVGKGCTVTLTFQHPKGLTPHYLKNTGFSVCFMYDFTVWSGFHNKATEQNDLKEVLMYFPALYKNPPSKEDTKVIRKLGFKDGFNYAEYLYTGRMQLNFLPVVLYSCLATATAFLEIHKDALVPSDPTPVKDKL